MMTTAALRRGMITATLLTLGCLLIRAEEYFGYNEEAEANPSRQNAQNRTPIYIPGKCGLNEILYPGDQENDWVCDCLPAHVYHPVSNGCHPLYTQAYCAVDEFVEIKPGAVLPTCTKNPCKTGLVPFNGTCVKLNSNNQGVCPQHNYIKFVIAVNDTTHQLECTSKFNRMLANRFSLNSDETRDIVPTMTCASGSAAEYEGSCTESTCPGTQSSTMELVPPPSTITADQVGDVQPAPEGSVE